MKTLATSLFLILLLTIGARGAMAQPDRQPVPEKAAPSKQDLVIAEQHHELGIALYKAEDFDGAAAEFSKSFALSRNTGVLFNLASAQRKARQCVAAETSYKLYAEMVPGGGGEKSAEVQKYLAELRSCVEKEREQEPKAEQEQIATPISEREPTTVEPPVKVDDRPRRGNTWRNTSMGISAAGLLVVGTGIYFGLSANSAADDLTERFSDGGEWDQDAIDLEDRHDSHKTLSYISTGVGAALVITGGVLFLLDLDEPAETSPTGLSNLRLAPQRHGLTVGWSMTL